MRFLTEQFLKEKGIFPNDPKEFFQRRIRKNTSGTPIQQHEGSKGPGKKM